MCNKQTPISIKYAWRHRNGQSRLIGLKMVLVVFQRDLILWTWLISKNELQTLDSKQIKTVATGAYVTYPESMLAIISTLQ